MLRLITSGSLHRIKNSINQGITPSLTQRRTILRFAIMANEYIMPAEGAIHSHTLMAFPSIASADNEEHLQNLQNEVVNIANTISRFEPVLLYTRENLVSLAKEKAGANVLVKTAATDQLWIRDSGPTYVYDRSGQRTAINFNFNYWGNKLPFTGDEGLAVQIAKQEDQPSIQSKLTTEGGAIEHDGQGTFLATESSLINDNRNPGMTKAQIEDELRVMLGVTHFIWVPGVRDYDITDYHMDILARFTEPGVVVISKPAPNAPDFAVTAYQEARDIISKSKDAMGRSLTVHDVVEPDLTKLGASDSENEVVGSYVNYHLVNEAVILPKYGQEEADEAALSLMEKLFPSREVVQVLINMLPRTGGGIHCATQQVITPTRLAN